jgi:hypothetical protein
MRSLRIRFVGAEIGAYPSRRSGSSRRGLAGRVSRWLQCRMRRDGRGGASTLSASKCELRSTMPGWRRRRRGARPCPSAHDADAPLACSLNIPSLCLRLPTLSGHGEAGRRRRISTAAGDGIPTVGKERHQASRQTH